MSKYILAFLTMILVFFGIYSMNVDVASQAAVKNNQYQNYLTTATYDAAKTMRQSMTDGVAMPTEADRKKVVKTFFNSLAMDFGYTTTEDMNRLHVYVPVVALIDTDGYYIVYNYEGKVTSDDGSGSAHKLLSVITSINTWTTNLSGDKGTYAVRYYLGHKVSVITPDGDEYTGEQEEVLKELDEYSTSDAEKFKTELGFREDPNASGNIMKTFESKRNTVIIQETEEKIEYYINQHNNLAKSYGTSYTFSMPETKQDDWIRMIANPTCIAFLQGMQVSNSTEYLNIYSLSGGELSKNSGISFDDSDGTKQYYDNKENPLSSSDTNGYMPNESSVAKAGDTVSDTHTTTAEQKENSSEVKHGGDAGEHYHNGALSGDTASLYGGCYLTPVFHQHTDSCYEWQSNLHVYSFLSGITDTTYTFYVTDTSSNQKGGTISIKAKDDSGNYDVREDDNGIYVKKNGTEVQIAKMTKTTGSAIKESVTGILGGPKTSYTIPTYHNHSSEDCYSYVFHSHKGSQVPDENRLQVIKNMCKAMLSGKTVKYGKTVLNAGNFDQDNYSYIKVNGVTYYAEEKNVVAGLTSTQLLDLTQVSNITDYTCYSEAGYHIHTSSCYASNAGETVYVKVPVYHSHTMPIVHYTSINNPDLDMTSDDVTGQLSNGISADYYPYYIENLESSCLYDASQADKYYTPMEFKKSDGSTVTKKVVDVQFLYTGSSRGNSSGVSVVNFRCGKTESTVDYYEQKYQYVNGTKVPVTVTANTSGALICGHSDTDIESYYNTCGKIDKNKMSDLEKRKWDTGIWTWEIILENGVDSKELSCGKTESTVESWALPANTDTGKSVKKCTKLSLSEIQQNVNYKKFVAALSDNVISKAEYNSADGNAIKNAISTLTGNGSITGWKRSCGHAIGDSLTKIEEDQFR